MSIDFSMENIKKCLCMRCPVQMESQCVKDKEKIMILMTQQDLDSPMRMDEERVPGLYCSTGKAICKDINTHQICRCNECSVWMGNRLDKKETSKYFCINGKAK